MPNNEPEEVKPEDAPPTERDKYIAGLEAKITKIGRAKAFKESDTGKLILELLQEESNAVLKRVAGKTYVKDHDGYIYDLGQLHMATKLITMIGTNASADVETEKAKLDAAKSGE